ncbi:hypothetical protein KIN20_024487 [Parelaphostrongylus tenuis]|uniref:Uncharacterized protein n=1 Tax=Parelaphostrongylus tenuis TaxID=148309 RepID=A0AAD5MTL3_PARTN|nr:hypothetical protein KIN20_024487 [Parelaphostrongylus tenuis]
MNKKTTTRTSDCGAFGSNQMVLKKSSVENMEMEDMEMSLTKKIAAHKRSEMRVPRKLLRDSVKLFLAITGKNVTKFDKKTLKLASPRLLSVVPEQDDDDLFNILSPSLFSLHEDGDEAEKSMSLPHLLKQLPNNDYEALLDFIIEASGVTETVDKTEKQLKEGVNGNEMLGKDGVPLHLNKKNVSELFGRTEELKIETFEKLDKSYTSNQVRSIHLLVPAVKFTWAIAYSKHSRVFRN